MATKPNDTSTVTYYPSFQALAAAMEPEKPRARLRPATDFPAEEVQWLWPGKIPIGKVTLLIGDPGLGKSLVAIDAAARVTRGDAFPSNFASSATTNNTEHAPPLNRLTPEPRTLPPFDSMPHAPGSVLILSAEDQIADTIRPRLDAAGADPAKVFFASEVTDLRSDLGLLAEMLDDAPDCRLIIVDPVTAYVGPSDSHFHTIVRKVLAPLAELAAKRKIAILAVTHLRKNPGAAITRATGSMGFAAAARCVWTVCRDQQNANRNLLLPVKNTFGPRDTGLAFSIERPAGSRAAIVAWQESPVTISAEEALTPIYKPRGPAADERRHAGEWLQRFLEKGPREAWRILDEGKHRGFGERTLRRALRELGGDTRKDAYFGGWLWSLTPTCTEPEIRVAGNRASASHHISPSPQPLAPTKKPVPLGETCPLPENTQASDAASTAANPPPEAPFHFEPPPPPVAESIRFLKQLDKNRQPPTQVASDSPTGHPLLDQLLANFRNPLTTDDLPLTTDNQQLTTQKKVPGAIPVFLREPTPGTSLAQRTLASPERCILATFPPKR